MQENKLLVEVVASNQTTTYCDVKRAVDFAKENRVKSLCVPQSFLKWAKNYAHNNLNLCTFIDCPNGHSFTLNKINAIKLALKNGADEIEIAINHNELKSGNVSYIRDEVRQIRRALRGRLFKLYVNFNILNESEFTILLRIAEEASVDYLSVDFNYLEEEFLKKYIELKRRVGKKTRLKLITNLSLDAIKSMSSELEDSRISVSAL